MSKLKILMMLSKPLTRSKYMVWIQENQKMLILNSHWLPPLQWFSTTYYRWVILNSFVQFPNIQFSKINVIPLVNKPYVNEVTLTGQNKVGIITLGMWYEPLGWKIWRPWVKWWNLKSSSSKFTYSQFWLEKLIFGYFCGFLWSGNSALLRFSHAHT